MKKNDIILGMVICIAVAFAALPIRLSVNDSIDFITVLRIVSYTFTVSVLSFFLHLYLVTKKSIFSSKKKQYISAILNIFIIGIIILPFDIVFDYVFFKTLISKSSESFHPFDQRWSLIILRSILISAIYFFIVFYLQLLQERQQRNLEIEKLKQAQLEANLSNLKEQMNPHFLFNTLNTLSSISRDKIVKDFVAELANVYRYMLVHNKLNIITLEQELGFIKSYLYIIKTRMGDSLDVMIDIDKAVLQTKMPPLALQLLLENAIKHNVSSVKYPLKIEIYNDKNYIIVSNSVKPKKSTQYSTGVGLNNLMNRYHLLFSESILITKDLSSFTVKLCIIQP